MKTRAASECRRDGQIGDMIGAVAASPADLLIEVTRFDCDAWYEGSRKAGKIAPQADAIALERGLVEPNERLGPDSEPCLADQWRGEPHLLPQPPASTFLTCKKSLLQTVRAVTVVPRPSPASRVDSCWKMRCSSVVAPTSGSVWA